MRQDNLQAGAIEIEALSVQLGGHSVLQQLSAQLPAGALTALIGENGSGKSTLLKTLAGELRYEGSARISGLEVQESAAAKLAQERAVLPQQAKLAFPFTALEVAKLGADSGPHAALPGLAEQALAAVGMAASAGKRYPELSGGEQQRVQLARVLAQAWAPVHEGRPRWLLLDEPVAALDLPHQLSLMRLCRARAEAGGGVLVILHDLNLTAMFADRVLLLKRGRLLAAGPVDAVLRDEHLSEAYDCGVRVNQLPRTPSPFVLPQAVQLPR